MLREKLSSTTCSKSNRNLCKKSRFVFILILQHVFAKKVLTCEMCQYTWYPTFWWIYTIIKIVLLLLFWLPIVNQYSLVISFFFGFTSEMCQYTKYPTFWWIYIYMYYYQNSFITCIVILNTNCDCCENCHLLTSRAQLEFYVRLL